VAVDVGAVSVEELSLERNQHRCGGAKGKDGGGKPRHWTVGQRKEENENPMEPTWGQEGKVTRARSKVLGFRFGPRGYG